MGVPATGAAAAVTGGGFLFIDFISEGTSYASTPSSRTPSTAAMIFCRLALAFGVEFLRHYGVPGAALAPAGGVSGVAVVVVGSVVVESTSCPSWRASHGAGGAAADTSP